MEVFIGGALIMQCRYCCSVAAVFDLYADAAINLLIDKLIGVSFAVISDAATNFVIADGRIFGFGFVVTPTFHILLIGSLMLVISIGHFY